MYKCMVQQESRNYMYMYGTQIICFLVAKMSLKQLRSPVKRDINDKENSSFLEKRKTRDERAGSRKREKREVSTPLSSSSSLSSLSPSLQYYNREIETDLSLHKGARYMVHVCNVHVYTCIHIFVNTTVHAVAT